MRWLAVLVVSAAGVALAAAGVLLLRDDGPEELLPDLDQAVPARLEIVEEGDSYRLVFASAVDNVGRGPLLIDGERPGRETAEMAVSQLVRRTDGSTRVREVPGVIRYAETETHEHWHLLGFAVYELRDAADGELVGPSEKTGFCLGDRYETEGAEVEGKPTQAVWTDECGRDQPWLLALRQGISPGYGDDYDPGLEGQFVDVTNVPPGRYVLVHRSNPERTLEESDYENNAASVLIQLRRSGAIPTVRVLARCPDADTCRRGQASGRG
ncbi:MAG TPA: lysyl oxidase family protein [Gaiellaceae bacterium]|nr:lysyl oxidase family protein [Gaiellaceae bacterium]